jgi:glutamate formiminotransferase / 5-formyltetrahydrofolate cyclo-ligase
VPIECVANVSEGRDETLLAELALTVAPVLLDRHTDANHHRSVFTLAGAPDDVSQALRELATACVGRLDLGPHQGAHPRLGVLDVVPFVPFHPGQLPSADLGGVVPLRNEFAQWLSGTFDLPSFLYGPLPGGQSRTLPQVRRMAFTDLAPDFGPAHPHPTAGATAVGARPILVAYNIWVSTPGVARQVAPRVRSSAIRALGLAVDDRAQVSCNLVDPAHFGPAQLYDQVTALVTEAGGAVTGAELVGLLPQSILAEIPKSRWAELGLSASATIESRLLN